METFYNAQRADYACFLKTTSEHRMTIRQEAHDKLILKGQL